MIRRQPNRELSPGTLARIAARKAERAGNGQPSPIDLLVSVAKTDDNIAAENHAKEREEAQTVLDSSPPEPIIVKAEAPVATAKPQLKGSKKVAAPVMEPIVEATTTPAPVVEEVAATTTQAPEPTGIAPAPWAKTE